MKIKFSAILGIATIVLCLSACDWFGKAKPETATFLEGKWRIDSLHSNKDSGDIPMAYILLAVAQKDNGKLQLQFTKDSMFTWESNQVSERVAYTQDTARKVLVFKDSVAQVYRYQPVSDSLIVLTDKDSVLLYLKKE